MDFKRFAGFAGVLAVVLWVVGQLLFGSLPTAGDSIEKVGRYLAEDNTMHKWALLLGFLAAIPFVFFLAGFLAPIFKSDREHGEAYGVVVFGGALLVGASAGLGDAASAALHLRAGDGLGAESVRGLWDLQAAGYGLAGIGFTILGAGAAMVIMRRKVMPDWVGWLAALVAVGGFFGLFGALSASGLANFAFVPFVTFLVFLLATGIHMIMSTQKSSAAA